MIRAHDDQVAPHLHVPDQDASRAQRSRRAVPVPRYMRDREALPHDAAFHLIDQISHPTAQTATAASPTRRTRPISSRAARAPLASNR